MWSFLFKSILIKFAEVCFLQRDVAYPVSEATKIDKIYVVKICKNIFKKLTNGRTTRTCIEKKGSLMIGRRPPFPKRTPHDHLHEPAAAKECVHIK